MSEPVWTADTSLGAWLGPRLARWGQGSGTPVTAVVPGGFDAYARVLHPVSEDDGTEEDNGQSSGKDGHDEDGSAHGVISTDASGADSVRSVAQTWAQVCAAVGTTAHPLMQWQAITRTRHARRTTTSQWPGTAPEQGNLAHPALAAALEVLQRFTPAGQPCVMALWDGFGWVNGTGAALFGPAGTIPLPPAYPPQVLAGPRLELPGRDYLLFTGPLGVALRLGQRTPAALVEQWPRKWLWRQSPSLLWPQDRSWCLATEVDFDSTVVAGPAALVDALCRDSRLEAYPVPAEADLSLAGDVLNAG